MDVPWRSFTPEFWRAGMTEKWQVAIELKKLLQSGGWPKHDAVPTRTNPGTWITVTFTWNCGSCWWESAETSSLSSEKQHKGQMEMEKGWQRWQQSPRLHSPAQSVTNSLPHIPQTDRAQGCFLLLLYRPHYSNKSGTLLSRLSCNHCWLPAY